MSTLFVTRLRVAAAASALLVTAFTPTASAQQPPVTETRPATVTVTGDTGLWFLPTAEVLPAGRVSASLFRANADFGQGYTDVSNFPLSLAIGFANRAEVFGSWTVVSRIDRDTRPLFGTSEAGAGITNDYPLVRQHWSGNMRGDLRAGVKVNLLSQADRAPLALAVRATVKAPVGNDTRGASTGTWDYTADVITSTETGSAELTAVAGLILRGDPDGFDLTNGMRWGVGAAFFAQTPLRLTAELHGERYRRTTITAPAAFVADDGSLAPLTSHLTHPIYAALGLTWQARTGWFVGGGVNWSGAVDPRVNGRAGLRDRLGIQVRLGYHPGVRQHAAALPAPVVTPPVAPTPAPIPSAVPMPTQTPDVTPPTPAPAPPVQAVAPVGTPDPPPVRTYAFEDVHFDFDRNLLRPDALVVLDDAMTALMADPGLRLRIEGHTCNIGTAEYNLALAERRAQAVRDYLTARGVDGGRLSIVSYGEERPLHDNGQEDTRRLNRRAALVVSVVR